MPSVTLTYHAGDAARFAAALGKAHNLVDAQVPPQPRSATTDECKEWLAGRVRQLIVDVEGAALTKAAADAVVVPLVDLT